MKRIEEGMGMYAMTGTRFAQTVAWDYAARASLQLGRPEVAGEYLREVMPHALSDQGEAYIAPELPRRWSTALSATLMELKLVCARR
jgi:hypothetical protein